MKETAKKKSIKRTKSSPTTLKKILGYIGEGLEEMGKTIWDSGFHYPPFM